MMDIINSIPPNLTAPSPAQQGWQCPCCRRVFSPSTLMCMFCQPHVIGTIPILEERTCPKCGATGQAFACTDPKCPNP